MQGHHKKFIHDTIVTLGATSIGAAAGYVGACVAGTHRTRMAIITSVGYGLWSTYSPTFRNYANHEREVNYSEFAWASCMAHIFASAVGFSAYQVIADNSSKYSSADYIRSMPASFPVALGIEIFLYLLIKIIEAYNHERNESRFVLRE